MIQPLPAKQVSSCYLCGSEGDVIHSGLKDRYLGVPGTWNLLQCVNCGLIWLSPLPDLQALSEFYEGSYYTHSSNDDETAGPSRALKSWLLDIMRKPGTEEKRTLLRLGRILNFFGPLREISSGKKFWVDDIPCGSLLDVGCGNGDFLLEMKRLGWSVQGIDPDPLAALAAQARGLSVQNSTLDEAGFPDAGFDVVTMSHVIEHVPDPIGLLKECRRVLKKGGQLVILTPNPQSLGRRIFRFWWYQWDPPRHLMMFSSQLLNRCVERAGLFTFRATSSARSARQVWQVSCLLRRNGSILGTNPMLDSGFGVRLGGLIFWSLESLACRWGNVGEEVRLHARRID